MVRAVSGFMCTGLYSSRSPSLYHSVCLSQLTSSRWWWSERSCAPRDSLRASADTIEARATSTRLSSSRASSRAVLKTRLLSLIWVRDARSAMPRIFFTPSASVSGKRNTPQCDCIVRRISVATSATDSPFFWLSSLARRERVRSAESLGGSLRPGFSLRNLTIDSAAALPKTSRSEERRVGKECRSRWATYHNKKKPTVHYMMGGIPANYLG